MLFRMIEQDYGEVVCFLTTRQYPERIAGKEPALKLAQNAFRKRAKKYELCGKSVERKKMFPICIGH